MSDLPSLATRRLLLRPYDTGDRERFLRLVTDPERGIGSALVRDGLRTAARLGHPDYYPRFGFSPAADRGVLPPFDVRREVFMALELRPGALAGVRGTVRYPAAFEE